MNVLWGVYIALSVFGLGVSVVDFLGLSGHQDRDDDSSGHPGGQDGHDVGGGDHASGHDTGHFVGHDGDHGVAHSADARGDSGHEGVSCHDAAAHDHAGDADREGGSDRADDGNHHHVGDHHDIGMRHGSDPDRAGRILATPEATAGAVARFIGWARLGVYFALGAGPTGIVALLTGARILGSLAWAAVGGVFVAAVARAVRTLVRSESDSSFKPDEFLMTEAVISVPVASGALGAATVRGYGAEREIYVRAADGATAFPKGARVRVVDFDDESYKVEAAG